LKISKKHCTEIGQVLRFDKKNNVKKRLLCEEAVKPLLFGWSCKRWGKVFGKVGRTWKNWRVSFERDEWMRKRKVQGAAFLGRAGYVI